MTTTRSNLESSLAQRGRPAMWRNEQDAAVLSGGGIDAYRPGYGFKTGDGPDYCLDHPKYTPHGPTQFGLGLE